MPQANPSRGITRFSVYEVDLRSGELRKHGVKVKLQEQPFQVLQALLERPGEVVTREELQHRIWPADTFVDFDHGLNNAVKRLREALGDSAETPRFIETLPHRGYRFIGSVDGALAGAQPQQEAPAVAQKNAAVRLRYRKLGIGVAATVGAIALVGILVGFNLGGMRDRLFARSAPPRIQSLAVLPLTNLSGDPSQEYFADGMTEELITELSQISALKVTSRTSVMQYKKTDKPLPQIARELGVDAVVEGSVRRSADRVRITVQLIDAPKDTNLWAQSYERDLRDALTLQSAVAAAIGEEIRVKTKPQDQSRLRSLRPVNPKAVDAYLAGRYHLHKSVDQELRKGLEKSSEEEFRKAVAYFEQAVQEDPNYIPAHLGFFHALDSPQVPHLDLLPRAKAAVAKALALDETLADAHLAMAWLKMLYEWDWSGAEKEFKRALELNPTFAKAHNDYGEYLIQMGRGDEGKQELELARAVDPGCDQSRDRLLCFGDEEHIDQLRKYLEETNSADVFAHGAVAKMLEAGGRYDESIAEWQKTFTLAGNTELAGVLGRAYTRGGYKSALRELAAGLEKASRQQYIPRIVLAMLHIDLGDKDRAFFWLEKAHQEHNWLMVYLKSDPTWDPIRSDPRFKDLLRRVGLPP